MNFRMRPPATGSPNIRVCGCQVPRTLISYLLSVENPRATGNRTMSSVPFCVPSRVLSGVLLPLSPLGAVGVHKPLGEQHVSREIAPAPQLQVFRTGNEFQNL